MRKTLVFFRKLFFWIFFVILFIITSVTVFLHIYEDDIKQFAIDKLNENLNTRVDVMDIDLTVFHSFPYATLQFNRVYIQDNFPDNSSSDTLFYADNLFMHFNVMNLINDDYTVERMSAENAVLNLKTNAKGDVNYNIVKKDSTQSQSSNFDFSLELLSLKNFRLNYLNTSIAQNYQIAISEGLFSGDFYEDVFDVDIDANCEIRQFKSGAFTLLKNKAAEVDINLEIDLTQKKYSFNNGKINVDKMPFTLSGFVDSTQIDLSITGESIKIEELANSILLDESNENNMQQYKGAGMLEFSAHISGPLNRTSSPEISALFSVNNASLTEPVSGIVLTDLHLEGNYNKNPTKNSEILQLQKFNFKLLDGFFKGNAEINDFQNPIITSQLDADIDLRKIKDFFQLNKINVLGGRVKTHFTSVIELFDPQYRKELFHIHKMNGTLNCNNVRFQNTVNDIYFTQINGDIVVNGNDAATKNLAIKTEKSNFKLDGSFKNLIPYIENQGSLGVIANIESEHIDLNEFVDQNENIKEPQAIQMFALPSNLNLNLEMAVNSLKWDTHQFQNIDAKFLMSGRKASLKSLKVNTLEGKINGWLTLDNKLSLGNVIEGKLYYSSINISKLFEEWENFDQTEITSENISGKASGSIDLLMFFNPYFSLLEDKLYVKTDLVISDGVLKNLTMMKSITDYMRSNKGLKLLLNKHIDKFEDKLNYITFQNLSNTIEIKKRIIHIPEMLIKSSALDVGLFGTHDFDNIVDYHFNFRFRELKTIPEETEYGIIEDDGLGIVIYLSMAGPLEDPAYALDKEARKNTTKENLAAEKDDFKSIMKSEFGLFKKDSTVEQIKEENEREVKFIYYEEDMNSEDTLTKKNKKRENSFFKELQKKSDKEKVKDVDVIIDE